MQATPASEFKKVTRKLYQLPSGRVVEIRKLGPKDVAGLGIFPLDFTEMTDAAREEYYARIKDDPDKNLEVFNKVLVFGVTRPRVVDGPAHAVGEDEIHVTDLGEDATDLFLGILSFSTGVPKERLGEALTALNPQATE